MNKTRNNRGLTLQKTYFSYWKGIRELVKGSVMTEVKWAFFYRLGGVPSMRTGWRAEYL